MAEHRRREYAEFVRLTFPAQPSQLAPLRQELRDCLTGLPLPGETKSAVVTAVNEAATNAIEHAYPAAARGTVELTFWTEPDALSVQVSDAGRWRQPVDRAAPDAGRGFGLMRHSVDTVLVHHDVRGTRVLLRHPLPTPALVPG